MVAEWIAEKVRTYTPEMVAAMNNAECKRAVGWLILTIADQMVQIEKLEFTIAYPASAFTWDLDEHPTGWDAPCMCMECRRCGD